MSDRLICLADPRLCKADRKQALRIERRLHRPRRPELLKGAVSFHVRPATYVRAIRRGMRARVARAFYLTVRIFPTVRELRAYYDSLNPRTLGAHGTAATVACVVPTPELYFFGEGESIRFLSRRIAEVLLPATQINAEVLPHECVHAATTTLRHQHAFSGKKRDQLAVLHEQLDQHEEDLAYLVGGISNMISKRLRDHGLIRWKVQRREIGAA